VKKEKENENGITFAKQAPIRIICLIPPFPLRLDVAFMSYTHGKEGERMTAHAQPDFSPYTIFQYITLF
jgi:hypothetical protein